MVDGLSTVAEDATSIEMPVSGINSHGQRSASNNLLNFFASVSFCDSKRPISAFRSGAFLIDGFVRVGSLSGLSVIFNPFETSDSISSVASVVRVRFSSGAVDELLLAEVDGLGLVFELNLIAFVSSSSSEGPT